MWYGGITTELTEWYELNLRVSSEQLESDTKLNVALHGIWVFEAPVFVFSLISKWGSSCRLSAAICEFACRNEDNQSYLFSTLLPQSEPQVLEHFSVRSYS